MESVSPAEIPALVETVRSASSVDERGTAAKKLAVFTVDREDGNSRALVANAGAIRPLIDLLQTEHAVASEHALRTLQHLSRTREYRDQIREEGGIAPAIRCLEQETLSSEGQEAVVSTIINLCSGNPANRAAIHAAGGVDALVQLLPPEWPERQIQTNADKERRSHMIELTAFALGAVAHGSNVNKDAVREAGGLSRLVYLLSAEPASGLARNATSALSTITSMCAANREALRVAGGVQPLVDILSAVRPHELITFHAVSTLAAMSTANNFNKDAIRKSGAVPLLVELLGAGEDTPVVKAATCCLMALCFEHQANCTAVREAGGVPALVGLAAARPLRAVTEKAAWALHNLAVAGEANQQLIGSSGGVEALVGLLDSEPDAQVAEAAAEAIRKAAAAALAALTADPSNKVSAAAEGAIPALLAVARNGGVAAPKARAALRALARNNECNLRSICSGGGAPFLVVDKDGASPTSAGRRGAGGSPPPARSIAPGGPWPAGIAAFTMLKKMKQKYSSMKESASRELAELASQLGSVSLPPTPRVELDPAAASPGELRFSSLAAAPAPAAGAGASAAAEEAEFEKQLREAMRQSALLEEQYSQQMEKRAEEDLEAAIKASMEELAPAKRAEEFCEAELRQALQASADSASSTSIFADPLLRHSDENDPNLPNKQQGSPNKETSIKCSKGETAFLLGNVDPEVGYKGPALTIDTDVGECGSAVDTPGKRLGGGEGEGEEQHDAEMEEALRRSQLERGPSLIKGLDPASLIFGMAGSANPVF